MLHGQAKQKKQKKHESDHHVWFLYVVQKLCDIVKRAQNLDYKAMLFFLVVEVTSVSINWNAFDQTCHWFVVPLWLMIFVKTQASTRIGSRWFSDKNHSQEEKISLTDTHRWH